MLEALGLPKAELSVLLCDDETIHALNREHRKKDKPTDVLAFALREGKVLEGAADLLGDVVISLDTAQRQAQERGRTLWDEVLTLLAHGLLHLVGYDHRTRAEERVMNARADILIAAAVRRGRSVPTRRPKPTSKSGSKSRRIDVDKVAKGIARRPIKGGPRRAKKK